MLCSLLSQIRILHYTNLFFQRSQLKYTFSQALQQQISTSPNPSGPVFAPKMKPQQDFTHVLDAKSVSGLTELRQVQTWAWMGSPQLWELQLFPADIRGRQGRYLQRNCVIRARTCSRARVSLWFGVCFFSY